MITTYKEKKLSEYLEPGQYVLIRFGHGLGDTLMFMPALEKLRELYPETVIDLYLECGQEEIFKCVPNKDDPRYDYIFHLDFPMSEGSHMTKTEKCCIEELGIEPPAQEFARIPNMNYHECNSPIVAVHFQGTALPGSVGCPEDVARKVWEEVKRAGKVPLECHFKHVFHNPANVRYDFVDNTTRGWGVGIEKLIWLLMNSHAFIGVASGPFVTAMCLMPKRVFYLERHHQIHTYTRKDVPKVNVNDYQDGVIEQWLKSME